MAEQPKEKIYRMKFEGSEQMIQNLAKIREEAAKVNAEMKKQEVETGKTSVEYAKLTLELKNLQEQERAQVKEIQNTEKAMKSQGQTLEGMRAKLSLMRKEMEGLKPGTEIYKAQEKAVKSLQDKVNLLDFATARYNGNVGNYKNDIIGAFQQMGLNVTKVQEAITGARAAMVGMEVATNKGAFAMKILKVAIISTGIGALVAIVGTLIAYFSSSSDRADKFKKIVAPFEQTFKAIEKAVFGFIDSLSVAFDWIAKVFGLVNDELQKQIDKDAQLRKDRKKTELDVMEMDVKRSQLLLEIENKQKYSLQERKKMAEEVIRLDDEKLKRQIEIAQKEYESIVENNKLKNLTDSEARTKEKEAQLKILALQKERFDKGKEVQAKLNEMINQGTSKELEATKAVEAAKKKAADEQLKRIEEEKKRIEELQQTAFEFSQQIFDLIAKNEAKVDKAKQDAENAMQKAFGNKPDYSEEQPVEESPEMRRIFAEHEYRRRLEAETAKYRIEQVRKAVEDGTMAESEGRTEIMKIRAEQMENYAGMLGKMKGLMKENTAAYKAVATAEALISTYAAIAKTLKEPTLPFPANVAMSVIIGAQGLMQVAKINAVKFAKGGIVGGRLHEQGGTKYFGEDGNQFEVERGELITVVNRYDTERLKTLSRLNATHGRPFFASGGMMAPRTDFNNTAATRQMISEVVESIAQIPVVVSEREITTSQRRVSVASKVGDL